MSFILKIQSIYPKTYKEIQHYIDKHHKYLFQVAKHISVDLEIGILIGFCAENAIELSFPDGTPDAMQDVFLEVFASFEEAISHYS